MDRRSFLIGSSTILTSAFVDKADWFLRNEKAVVPFEEVKQAVGLIHNSGLTFQAQFPQPIPVTLF